MPNELMVFNKRKQIKTIDFYLLVYLFKICGF